MLCGGQVAAGLRGLLTGACSARSAVAQGTTSHVRSLRSMVVITELFGVLPPEGAPIVQKLAMAVTEDLEQAQQQKDEAMAMLIREKDQKMVLMDKLRQKDKVLADAMFSAGVRDGRSCLEYLEEYNGVDKGRRVPGWTKLLKQRPDLINCLAKAAPSWGVNANHSNAAGVLADKIKGMFFVLNNSIHSFNPKAGLVVYPGVPDSPTSEALLCIAEAFGVPCVRYQPVSDGAAEQP